MRAPVGCENRVVEMLHAQTQPRDADLLQRFQLRLAQGARFAFKSNFFGVFPTDVPVQAFHKVTKLLFADVRRRAAAEVREPKLPPLYSRHLAVEFILFDQRIQVPFNVGSVLVCVDLEVTKLAPLAAKRNVDVQAERLLGTRMLIESLDRVRGVFRFPLRKRRIVGDEIITDFGFSI
jgi:hypothetical protein